MHPSAEDRAGAAEVAGAPGDVLAGRPAAADEVDAPQPEGEVAAAGVVAERVATQDVLTFAVGGIHQLARRRVAAAAGVATREVGHAAHRALLLVDRRRDVVLAGADRR